MFTYRIKSSNLQLSIGKHVVKMCLFFFLSPLPSLKAVFLWGSFWVQLLSVGRRGLLGGLGRGSWVEGLTMRCASVCWSLMSLKTLFLPFQLKDVGSPSEVVLLVNATSLLGQRQRSDELTTRLAAEQELRKTDANLYCTTSLLNTFCQITVVFFFLLCDEVNTWK